MTDVIAAPATVADPEPAAGTLEGAPPLAALSATPQQQPPAPVDPAALQRWNTLLSQQNSQLRKAIGVGKEFTDADIQAALNRIRLQGATEGPGEDLPPAVQAKLAQFEDQQREFARAQYGDVPDEAEKLRELVQAGATILELTTALYATVQKLTGTTPGGTPAAVTAAQSPVPTQPAIPSPSPGSEPPVAAQPAGLAQVVEQNRGSGDAEGVWRRLMGLTARPR